MTKTIRWGILGTGTIANTFATDLMLVDGGILVAVGSRDKVKAHAFAKKYNATNSYGTYEELAADPEVDAIYVATPHVLHKENSMLCLNHKKAVLCEKPIAINAKETKEMIDCARQNNVFLMEAMWTRFLPNIKWVRETINEGKIGEVKWIKADFGFALGDDYPSSGRLMNKALGGGSLLDVGIYPISFVNMIMKKQPIKVNSSLVMSETKVDLAFVGHFIYDQGEVATMFSAINTASEQEVHISGTKGSIHIPNVWFGDEVTITFENGEQVHRKIPKMGKGYCYEIQEVHKQLNLGNLESDIMPLEESLTLMKLIDEIASRS